MRTYILSAILLGATVPSLATAQAPVTPAPSASVSSAAAAMTTGTTTIGDMLDNAAAKAILQKHLPEVVASEQIDMARGMTLKDIQAYAADQVTDEKLAKIDHDLAALHKK